jgi:Arf-GAP/Rho-GAP domain/ANK repeat/PH domain-containing protein 3
MRRARGESGARLFRIEEFVMPHQIAAFFSRLAVQSRHQVDDGEIQEEDVNATVEESNFDDVRKNVDQNINLQHPIVFDQYDVCQLVHYKDLKKLTINMMERLCLKLGLATPNPSVRRWAPYEQALKEAVALCSCNV